MTWTVYPAKAGMAELAAEWDDCNRRLCRAHPYLDTAFVGPLVECFAPDDARLAVHRESAGTDAMLLLEAPRRGICSTFLPSQAQLGPVLLARAEAIAELAAALRGSLAVDVLCQDPEYSPLPALPPGPIHEVTPHVTTVAASLEGSFDAYWQGRPRKLREQMRRSLRKLEEAGLAVRLDAVTEPDQVRAAVDRYGLLESRGWKGKAGTSIHPDNVQGRFYRDVLARFAARGRGTVYELYFGGELAASELQIASDVMAIGLKTTYDETLSQAYSAGRLVHYLLLQRLFAERRQRVLEYYTNATPDTMRWSTTQRPITHHRFYRSAVLASIVRGYLRLKERMSRLRRARQPDSPTPELSPEADG
jgi:CelD/BcsL family acetyltransferase involved in cellulose biosynthesis